MAIADYAVTKIGFDDDSLRLDALSDLDYTMMQFLDGIPATQYAIEEAEGSEDCGQEI